MARTRNQPCPDDVLAWTSINGTFGSHRYERRIVRRVRGAEISYEAHTLDLRQRTTDRVVEIHSLRDLLDIESWALDLLDPAALTDEETAEVGQ